MFVRLELQIAKNEISGSVFVLRGKELLPQIGKLLSGYFLLSLLSSFSTVPGSSVRSVLPASRKENIIGRRFSLCCIENGKGKDGWDWRKADGKEKLNKTFSRKLRRTQAGTQSINDEVVLTFDILAKACSHSSLAVP